MERTVRWSASRRVAAVLTCAAALASALSASAADTRRVGRQADGSVLLPTNQDLRPYGTHVEFPGRPNALAIRPGGQSAAALTDQGPGVTVIDLRTGSMVQQFDPQRGDAAFAGIAYSRDGSRLYASMSKGYVVVAAVAPDGALTKTGEIRLGAVPGGLALSPDERRLYVTLNEENAVAVVDLPSGVVRAEIAVGNAPHSVVLNGGYAVVSNRGGRRARRGDYTNDSAGTKIVSDRLSGNATTGTVSLIDLRTLRVAREVRTGLHPNSMAVRGRYVFVANANSDTVSVLDIKRRAVVDTIAAKPFSWAPYGSSPNAIAVLDDSRILVSLGRNNAVAVLRWRSPRTPAVLEGLLPTGWYPAGIAVDPRHHRIVVANNKGVGALAPNDGTGQPLVGVGAGGVSVKAVRGSVSIIGWPTPDQLKSATQTVHKNNRWDSITGMERGSPTAAPKAIPDRIGDPSHIKHVFLVIKENRTYDQVLGDDPRGNGDPTKTDFGVNVTPNQHAIAAEYPLLDNFYVNGTVSADGHHWLVQSFVTDYIEEAFANFNRSYPYDGGDALAYAPSPFIWEHARRHGKTVKVYGEFASHVDKLGTRSDIPSLDRILVRRYPRFDLSVPDKERARIFIEELRQQIKTNTVPSLSIIQLPMDHTHGVRAGMPRALADMADHDEAFGQMIEELSTSEIWDKSAVFAVEDDAQSGLDHVDGHRTLAFVASPYARRGVVDSTYYTQIDMLRTIEQILGLPPMNQVDLMGTPMRDLFTDSPVMTEYHTITPMVPPQLNPPLAALTGIERVWAEWAATIDFTTPDHANEHLMNRAVWFSVHGFVPYPGDGRVLTPDEVLALPGLAADAD